MKQFFLIVLTLIATFTLHAQAPKVGELAPNVELTDTAGSKVSLASLKGKIVLVDFWASWCGPCRHTNTSLVKLYKDYKDKGFAIYGIAVGDEPSAWKRAIKADNITWSQVQDTKDVATKWQVQYIPNTYLLDKTGKVLAINPTHAQLEKLLKAQLKS